VDCVEPHPVIHSLLEVNLWANEVPAQRWKVALGDERRMLPMSSAPHNPGDTRLGQLRADERYDLVVPVIHGDELFAGRSFDVVKIGVQGYESEVILGLQRIVRQSTGIVLVAGFWPTALRERGLEPDEVIRGYTAMGFDIAVHDNWGIGNCAVGEVVAHCDSAGPSGQVNLILRHSGNPRSRGVSGFRQCRRRLDEAASDDSSPNSDVPAAAEEAAEHRWARHARPRHLRRRAVGAGVWLMVIGRD